MRAADAKDLPPDQRPGWYKPRHRGRGAGEFRTLAHVVNLSPEAVARLKRAENIRKYLAKTRKA